MSADSWEKCPRCVSRAEVAWEKEAEELQDRYGTMPFGEFEGLINELRAKRSNLNKWESYRTGREDWDIYGAETGTVTIEYGFGCSVCGLSADFKQQLVLPIEDEKQK